MKNELNNIEEIFKNTFENYEANVDASVWNNVQQSLNTSAASTGSVATSIASKSALIKIAAAIVFSSAIITSIVIYNKNKTPEKDENATLLIINDKPTIVAEKTELNTLNNNNKLINNQIINQKENKNKEVITAASLPSTNKETSIKTTANQTEKTTNPVVNTSKTKNETTSIQSPANNPHPSSPSTVENEAKIEPLNVVVKTNIKKGNAPLSVELSAEGNATNYTWFFNDGSPTAEQKIAYHTFTEPGVYEVVVEASDNNKQVKKVSLKIEVTSALASSLSPIPNIFTPNGDGKNDILKIEGENIASFQAIIMNQNGKVIFEWQTIDGFWDGRDMSNNPLPDGTYVVSGLATGIDGKKHPIKQFVTLRN